MCVNYFSGVDHGTLDQGASLLTSNRLSSAIDSQSRIKGTTCCCYFFCSIFLCRGNFIIIFFYQLLVAMIYKLPRANKVVDCRHRIRVNVVYFVAPIGHWRFCIAINWNACSD